MFPLIDHFVAVLEQPVAYTPTELAAAFREFVHGWGRQLLPPAGDLDPFDVLVIVPHHFLHGLPLHIVSQPDGTSLAARYGVTYCSSGTLFARCVDRNRARFPSTAIDACTRRRIGRASPRPSISTPISPAPGKQRLPRRTQRA